MSINVPARAEAVLMRQVGENSEALMLLQYPPAG